MDTLRGPFDTEDLYDDAVDFDTSDDDGANDLPPSPIGTDERRMQVRAYNHWAAMLGERNFPSIEELDPASITDFGPYSVLLDFSKGIEDPCVQYLGDELAAECQTDGRIEKLSDVPSRSLLSRITDHYMQILANQAPIGFEAEFINQNGNTILYRGILLPFSSDDETIDFIYGVINWKEMADQKTADELLLEIDQALEGGKADDGVSAEADEPEPIEAPVTDWADGPGDDEETSDNVTSLAFDDPANDEDDIDLPRPDFGQFALGDDEDDEDEEANYDFASLSDHVEPPKPKPDADDDEDEEDAVELSEYAIWQNEDDSDAHEPDEEVFASLTGLTGDLPEDGADDDGDAEAGEAEAGNAAGEAAAEDVQDDEPVAEDDVFEMTEEVDVVDLGVDLGVDLEDTFEADVPATDEPQAEPLDLTAPLADFDEPDPEPLGEDAGLYDFLASARDLAQAAKASEDRSRAALYAAVGRAYDFSLAAQAAPEDYAELLEENDLAVQERAPMTPIVKLVFGADYDKTRLTEYAAVLSHAHRIELEGGALADFLSEAEGGLKGVVTKERRIRKEESGQSVDPLDAPRESIAKKLRKLDPLGFEALDSKGEEFALVMIRRTEEGEVVVLGELEQDVPLIERAARKLLG